MSLDSEQRKIAALTGEHALVLAGPGCGKTHLLTRRVIEANISGRSFDDMVCLTFTNRAAREMNSRIIAELGYKPEGLFIGNIHRFCIKFLFDNHLVASEATVIDEEERDLWLSEALGIKKAADRKQVIDLANFNFQRDNGFPTALVRKLDFEIYPNIVKAAGLYADYKRENSLLDFDDVLLLACDLLMRFPANTLKYSNYHWIQVDEVQDLTPIQLKIVELITAVADSTVVFFGDEQQAIFDFIGAGGPALDKLKSLCRNHIYRLHQNYRSPAYLVGLCNDFAKFNLGIDIKDLSESQDKAESPAGSLQLLPTSDYNLTNAVAAQVRKWLQEYPEEKIAVLVRTNDEGESVSSLLHEHGLDHVLISRKDIFKQTAYKTVYAHFAVADNPTRMLEWSRLLYQTGSVKTLSESRTLTYQLRQLAATPADFLSDDGESVMSRMVSRFHNGEVVVFDTETTGLNVFEDDVVQIAAVKYRNGRKVDDGGFEILVRTDRPIPATLRDGKENPMLEIYSKGMPVDAGEAFEKFADYVGDATLCGHNVDFDCTILRNNIFRRLSVEPPSALSSPAIDTLLASRLLFPLQRHHNLETMIKVFDLNAVNSHNASDDVAATAELLQALVPMAEKKAYEQREFFNKPIVKNIISRFSEKYRSFYNQSLRMRMAPDLNDTNTLDSEMDFIYKSFVHFGYIRPIDRWRDVIALIYSAVIVPSPHHRFRDQLAAHIHELRTFNEGDILATGDQSEKVTVMTVHKAKGLEFDNVIVFNASHQQWGRSVDRARVYYVAFSRAKKRLSVFYSRHLSSFIGSVVRHFQTLDPVEVEATALIERLYKK